MRELVQIDIWILRLTVLIGFGLVILMGYFSLMRKGRPDNLSQYALAAWASANIIFILFLWFNHLTFPFTLKVLEGPILQHVQRAVSAVPIYPPPSPAYCAIVYNPLYYLLVVPFSWGLGVNLITLRIVSIVGIAGIGAVLFGVTRQRTNSIWWPLVAIGVLAAAYRVMDAQLDTAHPDAWLVCLAMVGTIVLDRSRSQTGNVIGIILLVCSFWMKQHGALFAIGGLAYLTLKEGWIRSIPYWLLVILGGPALSWFGGNGLFGTHFHYFTYTIPAQWTEITGWMFPRYFGFIVLFYGTLASFTLWNILHDWKTGQKVFDVWRIQLIAAMVTAVLGCLDPGSSDNIFIPMGVFLILEGIRGIHAAAAHYGTFRFFRIESIALGLVFAQMVYDPRTVVASSEAPEALADLKSTLESRPGSIYAPWIGHFEQGFNLYPTVHWIALLDIVRGPTPNATNDSLAASLLGPCIEPVGPTYVLTNERLSDSPPPLNKLARLYILDADFRNRFNALRVLPGRIDCRWPRYLYRFDTLQGRNNRTAPISRPPNN